MGVLLLLLEQQVHMYISECQAIDYGWNCTTGGCVSGSAANPGVYATLAECQSSCIPDYGWNCTVPGGCIPGLK
jgi:hypothetical protein